VSRLLQECVESSFRRFRKRNDFSDPRSQAGA
jgi:hypothetical protein